MTTPETPTGLPEEGDGEETSGIMAEAFANLAERMSGVATEVPPDESAPDDPSVMETASEQAAADVEESLPEVDEDSPFAAAAAIFESMTEPAVDDDDAAVSDQEEPAAESEQAEPAAADEAAEAAVEEEPAAESEQAESAPEAVVEEAAPAATDDEPAAADEAAEVAVEEEGEEEESEEALPPASPYDLPGGWYVVHSYSGYENKVQANLGTRIKSMHMEDSIFDIVIPMEEVVEIKSGRKVTVDRKQFPGYILVRMYMDDDSWGVVRNTPGVTGFVGSGTKPTPLPRREVERILGVRKDEEKKAPRFKPDWEVGETVRVIDGPFADFNGIIEDINMDQSKVRVLVDIFGRETPVELNFEQIQKF
jgi:transcriptional antiterminator NusG